MTNPPRTEDAIAVIGYSCRLPGSVDPGSFWQLLAGGGSAITEVPQWRWSAADLTRSAAVRPEASRLRWGGFLPDVDLFDAGFFGISPHEAATMDPQQRLALELGWETLEHAGIVPAALVGTAVGVFIGAIWDDYAALRAELGIEAISHRTAAGSLRAMIANRLSHVLGVTGPSLTVDSGQSSSLVAVHMACESLRRSESRAALAGGVNLMLSLDNALVAAGLGALSPTGRCHTFDIKADGYVRSEGGGLVMLKTLAQALADGDHVRCVILGGAVNNDGSTDQLLVPSVDAQIEVLRLARERAGVAPEEIQYVELHGTGTRVGDPVEAAALAAALGEPRSAGHPLRIGSVKTNIGHLEGAAGIAGLLKLVLSLERRALPASLNFDQPPPAIPLDRWNLRVQEVLSDWPDTGRRLVAGVSSFGMGGTNCHLILAESPVPPPAATTRVPDRSMPWVVSGRTPQAMRAQAERLARWTRTTSPIDVVDVAFSLLNTRAAFEHRAVVVAASLDQITAGLDAVAAGLPAANAVNGTTASDRGRTVMVFPGQGAQWVGMGAELLEHSAVFAERIAECAHALAPHVDWSLSAVLRGDPDAPSLDQVDVVQPVLFAVMVSLAAVWQSFGVVPDAVVGHSQGEIAAAVVAGALSVEDGAAVVALRSALLARLTGDAGMVSLVMPAAEVADLLDGQDSALCVAAVNGPSAVVVSGASRELDDLLSTCAARGIQARRVEVDYASHSPQVEQIRDRLADGLAGLYPGLPRIPLMSTVTGRWVGSTPLDASYWYANLRQTVLLERAVRALAADGFSTFVEVSPHPVLTAAVQNTLEAVGTRPVVLGTLRRGEGGWDRVLLAAGEAYARGLPVSWPGVFAETTVHRVELPTYAFQRSAHWLSTGPTTLDPVSPAELANPLPLVRAHTAALLGYQPQDVDEHRPFRELGIDSVTGVELCNRLSAVTERTLPTGLLFEYPTVAALAEFLRSESATIPHVETIPQVDSRRPVPVMPAVEPIAVVSMACRLPGGADTPEQLWDLVSSGGDAVREFPAERGWDLDFLRFSSSAQAGGFLGGVADFDAEFFGISPREALAMDPQQRLLLELGWEVFERAGIDPTSLRGSRTGVFIGAMAQDYLSRLSALPDELSGFALVGSSVSLASGRVAYVLGLEGPAVTVDTACSSSLVALHWAIRSLRSGECSLAVAGGVTVMSSPELFVDFSRQGGLAPDGRCKSFAEAADGTGWSEGAGLVLLERLSDARRHGHQVLALLRGSAVNSDGASNGLTAPNGAAQRRVILGALADAGLSTSDIEVLEAHGTGTTLGDPIEAEAVLATYGRDRAEDEPLWLGSLKSNIGHTQAAAGIAGVIKTVLALRAGLVPATLHVDQPSSRVDWSAGAVRLAVEARRWRRSGRPRRAAVSSFGISGTNAHVILEQTPETTPGVQEITPTCVPWLLSATGPEALSAYAAALLATVRRESWHPAEIGRRLATRTRFAHRAVIVGDGREDMLDGLATFVAGGQSGSVRAGVVGRPGKTVFVFPGQGSQWVGMGAELLATSPSFAGRIADCERALAPHVGWSLGAVLRAESGAPTLARVDVVQPTLFAVMVALADLWRDFGVMPDVVLGHSQGEIAAAVVAGGLSLADGARIVAARSLLLRGIAGTGGMVNLALAAGPAADLVAEWDGRLSIAALNSPRSTVVTGDAAAVAELLARCAQEGIHGRRVDVDYASHGANVDHIGPDLCAALAGIQPVTGDIPFYSSVAGGLLDTTLLTGDYWFRNLRQTVEFAPAVAALAAEGCGTFIEVSAHPVLAVPIQETLEDAGIEAVVLGTLRRDEGTPRRMLLSLAEAHARGVTVDWSPAFGTATGHGVELPTYPFQRKRYWVEGAKPPDSGLPADAEFWRAVRAGDLDGLGAALGLELAALDAVVPALAAWELDRRTARKVNGWCYQQHWEPLGVSPMAPPRGQWLVVRVPGTDTGVTDALDAAGLDLLPLDIDPGASRADLAGLLAALDLVPVTGVLSLAAFAGHEAVRLTLALVQALADVGATVRLWCITRAAQEIGASPDTADIAGHAVLGLGRTVALERPASWGGLLDLPAERLSGRMIGRIFAALSGAGGESELAVRASGLFARRLRRATIADRAPSWRPRGTALITGGTGGIGARVARWLAELGAPHLLLLGRRGEAAPGAGALRADLERLGASVTIAACDVSDRAALARVITEIPAEHPLDSVFHAAGVLDDGLLDTLTPERVDTAFAGKLDGACHLDELTAAHSLSAFVLFSSVMGSLGSAGQANYAAANTGLHGLAARRRCAGRSVTVVAWGAWAGEGMLATGLLARLSARGMRPMPTDLTVPALHCAIDRATRDRGINVIVADVDWRVYAAATGLASAPLLRHLLDAGPAEPAGPARITGRDRDEVLRSATDLVRAHAAAVLGRPGGEPVPVDTVFAALGFDSLTSVELRNRLAAATGLALPSTVLFEHPTARSLAAHLACALTGDPNPADPDPAEPAREPGPTVTQPAGELIAIVGIGCRFPGGVRSPEELWELLSEGRDAVTLWPTDRGWDLEALFDPDPDLPGTSYCAHGAFLEDVAGFDAEFFGISPREALAMDPQQRVLLETAWEAIERAGIDPASLRGRPVGVFIGTNGQDYADRLSGVPGVSEGHVLTGTTASVLSGRLTYTLGLDGPALTIDTACSSSLVALHLAVRALRGGECDQALAGGVTVMSTPRLFVEFSRQRGLALDGRCKAFGAGADGTGWGEGAGIVLLERLPDARRLGHPVLAVVRGCAVNSDGASNGLSAPNGDAQQRVIRAALADADLDAAQVDAVEAHGTGTRLGDPIEARALQAVYGAARPASRALPLGSVKSNIGHTQAAAGIAGVIKMVLALRAGELPRTLHVAEPSPHIDWASGGLSLVERHRPWPDTGEPRRAGVSAFGISGTNAHVIIEAAEDLAEGAPVTGSPVSLLIHGHTPEALAAQAARLRAHLDARPDLDLAALGRALATTRTRLPHRAVILAGERSGTLDALAALASGGRRASVVTGLADPHRRIGVLFPGQGAQRAGAGAALYRAEPVFANALDNVLAHFEAQLDRPLIELLFAEPGSAEATLLERTRYTQPALFAIEVALWALLTERGLRPDLLIGHSIGELAAATVAGVLDLPDGCALVAARARLMDALPDGGAMAAVEASEDEVLAALPAEGVGIAAVNGPAAVVVSGDNDAVLATVELFRQRGRRTRRLAVSHAFHSARLDPMLAEFHQVAAGLRYAPPAIPIVSNRTGRVATTAQLCDPEYWVRHVREAVRFHECVRAASAEGVDTFLELGPGGILCAMTQEALADAGDVQAIPLLRDDREEISAVRAALGGLYARGVDVRLVSEEATPSVELPTYAFQHRRFWPESAGEERLRYRVEWRPAGVIATTTLPGRWLVVRRDTDDAHLSADDVVVVSVAADADRAAHGAALRAAAHGSFAGVVALPGRAPGEPLAAILALVQALGDVEIDAPLWCVTTGAAALGGEPVDPAQALVWGLGLVAALEHPHRWGGLIDLPAGGAGSAPLEAVLAHAEGEDQLAVRGDRLFVRRLVRAPRTARTAAPWVPRDTVLITGGTGGLGARVAEWAARCGAEHLVLISRRGPRADGVAELTARLSALGARCTAAACDIADRAATARLLESLRSDGEIVRAVVHAAGVVTERPLVELTPDELAAQLAAKVDGAMNLHDLVPAEPLERFVLFSSIAATWGSGGQAAYAAANAHLDALAEYRAALGLPATSVAWGPWSGPGMAAGAVTDRLRAYGLRPMGTDTALAELGRVLDEEPTTAVVSDVDWSRFLPVFRSARPARLLDEVETPALDTACDAPGPPARSPWHILLSGLPSREGPAAAADLVLAEAAAILGYDGPARFEATKPFREAGFDSLTAVELRNRLIECTGLALPLTVVFDYPSAATLGRYLFDQVTGASSAAVAPPVVAGTPADDPLAIVSMACRFPSGVRSPEHFWRLLVEEVDAISALPADRGWNLAALLGGDPDQPGTIATTGGGFLNDAGEFDADFFGISPREALAMDPQQRLLLETSWEALERAGIDPTSVRGAPGGVFVGVAAQGYGSGSVTAEVEGHLLSGTVTSVASGRISYLLGLEGPAVTVETACSSSLVALHLAGHSLRSGECSFALVGGAAVMASPDVFVEFSRQGGLSPDGRCRSFADEAGGTGWAEGVGVLLVERLSQARRNAHPVLAIVRGSAVNQDGASNGLTAPNGPSQQRVIRAALANAGLSPADVDMVEAHGTGTTLGDPIEAQALLATYGQDRDPDSPLWIGSLKSNLGHTQAAAGVAGVIKTVLALRAGILPRTLHVERPSTRIDWSSGGVALLDRARPWPRTGRPRRAGVSAFGMSGTNAHVVVEEAVSDPRDTPDPGNTPERLTKPRWLPWVLSAKSEGALRAQARTLRDRLREHPELDPADLALSLATQRAGFPHRAVLVATDHGPALDALAEDGAAAGLYRDEMVRGDRPVFVFPGQGSQWAGMAVSLLDSAGVFAEAIGECDRALAQVVDWSLPAVLRGTPGAPGLDRVDVVQPALFAIMVALARLWIAAGVQPAAVIGHSQGEIAAACVAGALSLEDAARVVALRGRALSRLAGTGGMISLELGAEASRELLAPFGERISLAALNGPAAAVVSGVEPALTELLELCDRRGIRAKRIPVDYAAHSAQVADIEIELTRALAGLAPRAAEVPIYSTVTGERLAGEDMTAGYWYRNLREPVRFADAVDAVLAQGHELIIEVSPHPVLLAAITKSAEATGGRARVVDTLRRSEDGPDRWLGALAEAWTAGATVAWPEVLREYAPLARPVTDPLPTYPFQRSRYWLPTPGRGATDPTRAVPGGAAPQYRVDWDRLVDPGTPPQLTGDWLVVEPGSADATVRAVIEDYREHLRRAGATVTTIGLPSEESAHGTAAALRPVVNGLAGTPAGVLSLLALAQADDQPPAGTLMLVSALGELAPATPLWCVTSGAVHLAGDAAPPRAEQAMVWGLGQVVGLEQPDGWGGLIDLPAGLGGGSALVAALAGAYDEDQIAVRSHGVHARRLVRATPPAPGPEGSWRPTPGSTVVLGADTAVGADLARWIVGAGARRVILVGGDALVDELTAAGADITVASPDPDLAALVARPPADAPVTTVVYALDTSGPGRSLTELTPAEVSAALRDAVRPLHTVDQLAGDATVILTHPLEGVWGAARRGASGVAQAAVAAWARQRRERGLPTVVLAVGGRDPATTPGLRPLGESAVPATAQALLDHGEFAGIVADVDWQALVESVPTAGVPRLLRRLPEASTGGQTPGASADRVDELIARLSGKNDTDQRRILLDLVSAHVAAVLGHPDTHGLRANRPFFEAGFDSMLAVRFRNRFSAATGLPIAATAVFDHPTPLALAEHLRAALAERLDPAEPALTELDRLEAALSAVPDDPVTRESITLRLRELTRRWERSCPPPGAGPDHSDLATANADELFALLDGHFGTATGAASDG